MALTGFAIALPVRAQNSNRPLYQGAQPQLVQGVQDGVATGQPKIRHVYLAAPDILSLVVDAGQLWAGPVQPYVAQPGDVIKRFNPQNYGTRGAQFFWNRQIIRGGKVIGNVVLERVVQGARRRATLFPQAAARIIMKTFLLFGTILLAAPTMAQTPAATTAATPRPTPLVSPEIHADNTVTFRLKAPDANKVALWGDLSGNAELDKDENGVWTTTIGPLAPDIYGYSFRVDGRSLLDPQNTWAKPSRAIDTSVLEMPGAPPVPYDYQPNVAHGEIHLHDYDSKSLGKVRRLRVYTPPHYNQKSRYPILYLLHGSGDNEATWTEFGRANVILDNLIAARKAVPMIVVMTDGHAASDYAPDARGRNASDFERDLLGDVMPFVENRYRVKKGRENRAIAGLSMGGNQALLIGLNHRDLFASIGAMSSAIREPEKPLAAFWADPNSAKTPLRLLWLSIGTDDFLIKENRAFDALLTTRKVPHQYIETTGGHTWTNWRRYLAALAPRLFEK